MQFAVASPKGRSLPMSFLGYCHIWFADNLWPKRMYTPLEQFCHSLSWHDDIKIYLPTLWEGLLSALILPALTLLGPLSSIMSSVFADLSQVTTDSSKLLVVLHRMTWHHVTCFNSKWKGFWNFPPHTGTYLGDPERLLEQAISFIYWLCLRAAISLYLM